MELYIKYTLHKGRWTTEVDWGSQETLYREDGTWVEIGRNRTLPSEPVWWTENISKEVEGRSLGREAGGIWVYSWTPWCLDDTEAWMGGGCWAGWSSLWAWGVERWIKSWRPPYILLSLSFYLISTYCSCKVHNLFILHAASSLTVFNTAYFLPSSSQVLLLLKGSQAFLTNLALEDLRDFFFPQARVSLFLTHSSFPP